MNCTDNNAARLRAEETAEQLYQKAVNAVWWRNCRDEPWAGTCPKVPAHSWYPNLAAEMEASQNSAATVKNWARISGELLAAVLDDYELLRIDELYDLSRLWGCPLKYLRAGTLQIVDPSTNKGKFRRRQLHDLLAETESEDPFYMSRPESTLADLETGKVVTYACWRWSMDLLISAKKAHSVRTIRSAMIMQ